MKHNTRLSTLFAGLLVLGIIAVQRTAMTLGLGGDQGGAIISDVGEAAVILLAGIVMFYAAFRLRKGEPLRTQWVLMASGVTSFAFGDIVWSYWELGLGENPFPSVADLFYLMEYVLVGAALILAVRSYRAIVDVRGPVASAVIVAAAVIAMQYRWMIAPHLVGNSHSGVAAIALSIFYPAADAIVYLIPALTLLFISARLGGGAVTRPWWPVALGAVTLCATDIVFSWSSAVGTYAPGNVADYGWTISHVLFAVGALMMRDLAHPPVPYVRMMRVGE